MRERLYIVVPVSYWKLSNTVIIRSFEKAEKLITAKCNLQ